MPLNNARLNIGQTTLPKSRTSNLVIQEVDDDLLVYDITVDKAHHLNETISLIWSKCDGKTTFDKLVQTLEKELKTKIETDFIWLALKELEKANLLEENVNNQNFKGLSRRKVLFKYALPSLVLPVIVSLVAPQVAQAQSCLAPLGMVNDPCSAPSQCCPGLICVPAAGFISPGTCQPPPII